MEQRKEDIGTRKDLVLYRLRTAKADLKAARILFAAEEYKGANNRAYYAIFHAINAIHALSGKAYKRHKDAIGNFNKDYVKTEIFPEKWGRKSAKLKKFAMPVIMMTSILPVEKNLRDRLLWQMNLYSWLKNIV